MRPLVASSHTKRELKPPPASSTSTAPKRSAPTRLTAFRPTLTPSERALFTQRRKEAYEALHPETKAHVAQAVGMNRAIGNNVTANLAPTFTADTAARTGQSERSVQRDATRGGNASGTAWRWAGQSRRPRAGFPDHDAENHMPVAGRSIRRSGATRGCDLTRGSQIRGYSMPKRHGWIAIFAHKPYFGHEIAPLDPKNRRKPQGTASGLRFFRAANSTIYLQFSQALPQNRRNRRNRKGCQSPETA